eukprot:7539594-Pyramimonas_sp.AAC.1
MAHCFPRASTRAIEPWTTQWRHNDEADNELVVKCPITRHEVDVSLPVHADDINSIVLLQRPAAKEDVHLDKLRGKAQGCDKPMDE